MCRDRPGRLSRRPVAVGGGRGAARGANRRRMASPAGCLATRTALACVSGFPDADGWKHLAELCARAIDFDSILQLNKIILNFNTVVRSISESSQSSIFLCGVMSLSVK